MTSKEVHPYDDPIDNEDFDSSFDVSINSKIEPKQLEIQEKEELKRKECDTLDTLVAIKERQIEDVKAR